MRFCSNCGNKIEEGMKFCPECGQRLAKAAKYEQEIARHRADLSVTALTLASNFESYLDKPGVFGFPGKIGVVVYGGAVTEIGSGQSVQMRKVDKSVALNLLYHLKEEFPELLDLNEWAELTGDRITLDLMERLRLKAYRGDFKGKCKDCSG